MSAPSNPFAAQAPLRPGDRVAIVSPSSPAKREHLDAAVGALRAWGLEVVVGESALAVDERASYLAGSDEVRRRDLVTAWTDPAVAAVVALRGGYGAMRLLDGLDFRALRAAARLPDGRPKLLTGSSDITALHRAWQAWIGVPTLFSPMPGNAVFADSARIRADVRAWMLEPWGGRTITGALDLAGASAAEPTLAPEASQASASAAGARPETDLRAPTVLAPGTARGVLTGGNLSLIAASLGAPEDSRPGADGTPAIAVLEDVDEDPQRLDNLLLQLERSGWFESLAGIVLGSWQDCGDPAAIEGLLREYFAERAIPVVAGLGLGHDPEAPAVGLGVPVELRAPAGGAPALEVLGEPAPPAAGGAA